MSSEIIYRAADTARLLVHIEMAYDVLDEMASNPRRYVDSLQKLSRLSAKVLNDIPKIREKIKSNQQDNELKEALDYLERKVSSWALEEKDLIKYLEELPNDEERAKEIKKFAALAVAPDRYTLRLKQLLGL